MKTKSLAVKEKIKLPSLEEIYNDNIEIVKQNKLKICLVFC